MELFAIGKLLTHPNPPSLNLHWIVEPLTTFLATAQADDNWILWKDFRSLENTKVK